MVRYLTKSIAARRNEIVDPLRLHFADRPGISVLTAKADILAALASSPDIGRVYGRSHSAWHDVAAILRSALDGRFLLLPTGHTCEVNVRTAALWYTRNIADDEGRSTCAICEEDFGPDVYGCWSCQTNVCIKCFTRVVSHNSGNDRNDNDDDDEHNRPPERLKKYRCPCCRDERRALDCIRSRVNIQRHPTRRGYDDITTAIVDVMLINERVDLQVVVIDATSSSFSYCCNVIMDETCQLTYDDNDSTKGPRRDKMLKTMGSAGSWVLLSGATHCRCAECRMYEGDDDEEEEDDAIRIGYEIGVDGTAAPMRHGFDIISSCASRRW